MNKLELYNLQLTIKKDIINRINTILVSGTSTVQDLLDAAFTIEELGMKHLSRYYPTIVENMFTAINSRIGDSVDPGSLLRLSKVLTTALTEPYTETRRDDMNFDLSTGVKIGRRRLENIGHILLKDKKLGGI